MNEKPCTLQPKSVCKGCTLSSQLMCRYDVSDTLNFFMAIIPFFATIIIGLVRSGNINLFLIWLGYILFFFFAIEGRVLCSHCPYWQEEGIVLHCHANYGVIKFWKYRPQPMNRIESAVFLASILLFLIIPIAFLIMAKEYTLSLIAVISGISFSFILIRNICVRCIHFSCPLNRTPRAVREQYLNKNLK